MRNSFSGKKVTRRAAVPVSPGHHLWIRLDARRFKLLPSTLSDDILPAKHTRIHSSELLMITVFKVKHIRRTNMASVARQGAESGGFTHHSSPFSFFHPKRNDARHTSRYSDSASRFVVNTAA
jgi:hypothetical protein